MNTTSGVLSCVVLGLVVALYSGNRWWWIGLIGSAIVTMMHFITKSEALQNLVHNCEMRNIEVRYGRFAFSNFITNLFITGIIFVVVRIILTSFF